MDDPSGLEVAEAAKIRLGVTMFPTFLLLLATLPHQPPNAAEVPRFDAAQSAISALDDAWTEGDLTFASWGLAVRTCGEALVGVLPAASHPKATAAFDALNRCRMAGNLALGAKAPSGNSEDWYYDTQRAIRDLHLATAVAIHATPGAVLGSLPEAPKVNGEPHDAVATS